MDAVGEKLEACYASVREKISFRPDVALVLGSGLGDYADTIEVAETLDYSEIRGFPVSTIPGHRGRFVFGYVGQVRVVVMQGRVHYYEGYAMTDVVLPIRLMGLLGAKALFLTNAAGGVNFDFQAGDFMMITDHISSFVPSPLAGPNLANLGQRFSDMSQVYDKELQIIIEQAAHRLDIPLKKGVYIQLAGPNYETPQEVRMCRILGADAVGMSTACEAIAANHMGMKICGISCITNLACGMTDSPLSHREVQEISKKRAPQFRRLVTESILAMEAII